MKASYLSVEKNLHENVVSVGCVLSAVSEAGHFLSPVMRRANNLKWWFWDVCVCWGVAVKAGSKISPSSYNASFVVTAD